MKLEKLAENWKAFKSAERAAQAARLEVEEQIIALTGAKEEGALTVDAGEYKICVTAKLTRTLDPVKWEDIKESIPERMRPVTYKPALDLKGLRYLELNEPDTYRIIAKAIETKPAKTSVEVK